MIKLRLFFLSSILSIAINSKAQIKLGDLNVDTTITGFKLAADFQGTIVYTKNGPPDIHKVNPSAFSFTIAPGLSSEVALAQLDQLMNMSKGEGYVVTDIVITDTAINGFKAYSISYTETLEKENYKNLVFNAFVIKDNTLILFVSGDLDRGIYIEKFKKTFYSIKL